MSDGPSTSARDNIPDISAEQEEIANDNEDFELAELAWGVAADEGSKKRTENLRHLLLSLDLVVYLELSALYYLE